MEKMTNNAEAIREGSAAITIAVFPFDNLTPGSDTDLFCQSFCMDLTTELSKFRQFQVLTQHALPDNQADKMLLSELDADYHIHGSFRADSKKIRLNAHLVNSRTLHMVWANRFEAPLDEMMDIQENLVQDVLGSLQEQLNYNLLSRFRKNEKTAFSAYELWLHGMEELKEGTPESDERARENFLKVIDIDPDYSLAYTGMSLSYFNDWSCQLWERWEVNQNGAFEWAQKAIELDENNYQAAAVLGRIFLYEEAFETAEHYVRRSLRLNNNDPATLIQNAVSLIYLGHSSEASELYAKALRINPSGAINYNHVGIFIRIEEERFKEALELIRRSPSYPWVDAHVFIAAVYFHLKDFDKMQESWEKYLREYKRKISKSSEVTDREALDWFVTVNPYRGNSPVIPFIDHISQGASIHRPSTDSGREPGENLQGTFIPDGDLWTMEFDGKSVVLPEVKGFHDLQTLLENPGQPFHCAELMDAKLLDSGAEVLDNKAKSAYQRKILELQEEIEQAEDLNDFHRSSDLQKEYDELLEHLTGALGLGGRSRKSGGTVEKARSAVTWRIRSAISKIEKEHPRLGIHLSNSVRTGTTCSYTPEQPFRWN